MINDDLYGYGMEIIGIMVVYGDFVHDQNLGVPFFNGGLIAIACVFRKMDGSTNRFLGPEKTKSKQKVRFHPIFCELDYIVPCFKS